MPDNIPSSSWRAVADALKKVPRQGLVQLLKDLYHTHGPARTFLEARLEVGSLGKGLESAFTDAQSDLRKILQQAEASELPPFADARKRIEAYRKASLDDLGTVRLKLTLLAWGLRQLANGAGPGFVSPVLSELRKLDKVLRTPDGRELARDVAPLLREVAEISRSCGYEFGDEVPPWVEEVLAGIPEDAPSDMRPRRFDGDPDFDSA